MNQLFAEYEEDDIVDCNDREELLDKLAAARRFDEDDYHYLAPWMARLLIRHDQARIQAITHRLTQLET
jgi:hypothetical protein